MSGRVTRWAAPGRVNLIGEHTDYNDGYVLPIALPRHATVTATARDDDLLVLSSAQEPGGPVQVRLPDLAPGAVGGWAAYPAGVAWALRAAGGRLDGAHLSVDGEVPLGAGLSSSAALECATAAALDDLFGLGRSRTALAMVAHTAEHDFVGVPVGVMDQMASMLCTAGHALFLDARSHKADQVPLDLAASGLTLLVVDTRAPHRLVDGEYADRRRACADAAQRLGVRALRDVADLPTALAALPDPRTRRRLRHVVTENARVLEVVERLRTGAAVTVGPLLTASHESLRDDFEVSSPELDLAVDTALAAGALGARMTGGGFGGCAIALVPAPAAAAVREAVGRAFGAAGYGAPVSFTATPSQGAHRA